MRRNGEVFIGYLVGFVIVLALGVVPIAGCGDDFQGCGSAADGTPCGNGAGTCQQGSCQMACTEQGIRDAIAAGGGPYTFGCSGPHTVVTRDEIVIDKNVILDGEGNLILDGNDDHRVLSLPPGVTATLNAITITRGRVETGDGGGIATGGTLTLSDVTVSRNTAIYNGDGLYRGYGGGIYNVGTLALTDSTVSDNSAAWTPPDDDGIIFGGGGRGGGIDCERGTVTLTNSTVSGNTATHSGGGISRGTVALIDSTVSNNLAGSGAGGISSFEVTLANSAVSGNSGGGIMALGAVTLTNSAVSGNTFGILTSGVVTLTNSTVSGNGAGGVDAEDATLMNSTVSGNSAPDSGGGIWASGNVTLTNSTVSENSAGRSGGGISAWGNVTLTNSTVSDNTAVDSGGGIESRNATLTNSTVSGNSADYAGGISNSGRLILTSSTVSNNTASEAGGIFNIGTATVTTSLVEGDCLEVLSSSSGFNIESPGNTCGFDTNKGDQVNVSTEDLNLGPLQDNGGPTMTHALQTVPVVSTAIDQIPEADCGVTTDQRGVLRPQGPACDVGAFELEVGP